VAEDRVFAANPRGVQQGADLIEQIRQMMKPALDRCEELMSFDPQDPPWGDDPAGHAFENAIREPVAGLFKVAMGATEALSESHRRTSESGTNFERASSDNLDTINADAGRRV
jgi:hypothetical protein